MFLKIGKTRPGQHAPYYNLVICYTCLSDMHNFVSTRTNQPQPHLSSFCIKPRLIHSRFDFISESSIVLYFRLWKLWYYLSLINRTYKDYEIEKYTFISIYWKRLLLTDTFVELFYLVGSKIKICLNCFVMVFLVFFRNLTRFQIREKYKHLNDLYEKQGAGISKWSEPFIHNIDAVLNFYGFLILKFIFWPFSSCKLSVHECCIIYNKPKVKWVYL